MTKLPDDVVREITITKENNMQWLELDFQDIEAIKKVFGDATINGIRESHGLTAVVGGEQKYTDWLKENWLRYPTPKLKIVANPFIDKLENE